MKGNEAREDIKVYNDSWEGMMQYMLLPWGLVLNKLEKTEGRANSHFKFSVLKQLSRENLTLWCPIGLYEFYFETSFKKNKKKRVIFSINDVYLN